VTINSGFSLLDKALFERFDKVFKSGLTESSVKTLSIVEVVRTNFSPDN